MDGNRKYVTYNKVKYLREAILAKSIDFVNRQNGIFTFLKVFSGVVYIMADVKRFTYIRKKYIPEYFYKNPNVIKYSVLLNSIDFATSRCLHI